jgi:2-iminobutanoate/2-iminopropanoate deaminase
MQRRDLNAPDAYRPVAAYTQAIEVSGATRTLYISGQIGQRMDGTIPDDIVVQAALLGKAAGMTLNNLVKTPPFCPMAAMSSPPARRAAKLLATSSPRAL